MRRLGGAARALLEPGTDGLGRPGGVATHWRLPLGRPSGVPLPLHTQGTRGLWRPRWQRGCQPGGSQEAHRCAGATALLHRLLSTLQPCRLCSLLLREGIRARNRKTPNHFNIPSDGLHLYSWAASRAGVDAPAQSRTRDAAASVVGKRLFRNKLSLHDQSD